MSGGDMFGNSDNFKRNVTHYERRKKERGFALSGLATKLIIAGVVLAILGGVGLTVWSHYTGLLEDNATLKSNNAKLEITIAAKNVELASLEKQAVSRAQVAAVSRTELLASRAKVNDLREKLSKHDLGALIVYRPKVITGIMQRGTRARFKSIEGAANAVLE